MFMTYHVLKYNTKVYQPAMITIVEMEKLIS